MGLCRQWKSGIPTFLWESRGNGNERAYSLEPGIGTEIVTREWEGTAVMGN